MRTRYLLFEGADYISSFDNCSITWTRSLKEAYNFGCLSYASATASNLNGSRGRRLQVMKYDDFTKANVGFRI